MSLGVFTPLTEAQHSGRVWILKSFLVCCVQCYLWSEFIKRSMITLEGETPSSWISGECFFFPNIFSCCEKAKHEFITLYAFSADLAKEFSHVYYITAFQFIRWVNQNSLPSIHTILSLHFKVSVYRFSHSVFQDLHTLAGALSIQHHSLFSVACVQAMTLFWDIRCLLIEAWKIHILFSSLLSTSAVALVKTLLQALAQFCDL